MGDYMGSPVQILFFLEGIINVMRKITLPLTSRDIKGVKAGDQVLLSGTIYTARDQAHKRMVDLIKKGKKLPLELKGQVLYYCGPTPAPKDRVIGSCGPTTSGRMDPFTCDMLDQGVKGLIGKGKRDGKVIKCIKKNRSVYFLAPAGCGAFLREKVTSSESVAFRDLGPEAIFELNVKDFPVIVGIDSAGNDVYKKYNKKRAEGYNR